MMTGSSITDWRKAHAIKQAALADYVGVSQATVSRWERGIDQPNLGAQNRLRDLVSKMMHSDMDLLRHRVMVENLPDARALFDYDGIQFITCSERFEAIWPGFSQCQGMMLRDYMVGETRELVEDDEMRRAILSGDVLYMAGVSERHTLGVADRFSQHDDTSVRHCWSVRFHRSGRRTLVEMSYQPCPQQHETGITKVIRLSEFDALAS